jgi:signal transduction histidine kinase
VLTAGSESWTWHGGAAAVAAIFLLIRLIGLADTLFFALLYGFFMILLSLYPLILLAGLFRLNGHPLLYLFAAAAALEPAGLLYDGLSGSFGLHALQLRLYGGLLYLAACGLLLAQESYLRGSGWQELHLRLGEQQRKLRQAHSRLIQTENTLLLQDRLIATGVLAAAAAHEFKNTLSLVRTTAAFAARQVAAPPVRSALEMIEQQVCSGDKAVNEFLEPLLQGADDQAAEIRLNRDLSGLIRMMRAACRREGVTLSVAIPEGLRVCARRGELEQVLVNLLRNAMDALRSRGSAAERRVAIRAARIEDPAAGQGNVMIEVSDSGEGISPQMRSSIFDISVSGKQSTGMGLFLAKVLVQRNSGTLDCVPVERGCCFRILLPAAD